MKEIEFPEEGLTPFAINIPSGSYESMQKIIALWKEKGIADHYMALQVNAKPIQLVPYERTSNLFSRMLQQIFVLWRFAFGGYRLTPERVALLKKTYSKLKEGKAPEKVESYAQCAFCDQEVIDRQLVLDGKRVQVLYNYAPLGMGGERLHFLIVSKRHCPRFDQLTQEEYEEALQLSDYVQKRVKEVFQLNPIQNTYTYHKTGVDAGQSVPHWHLHLVMTQTRTQEWWSKLTILKNILFGSFPLSRDALKTQKDRFYTLLNRGAL